MKGRLGEFASEEGRRWRGRTCCVRWRAGRVMDVVCERAQMENQVSLTSRTD